MAEKLPQFDQTFIISHEHLDVALAHVSLGFWEVNLTNNYYMTCTRQCKINYGWDPDSAFSYQNMLGCIIEEDVKEMQEKVIEAITSGQPYSAQYRVRYPDGSVHWIEAQGKVFYEDGQPVRISGTSMDITKSKGLEILRDEMLSIAMHELKTPITAINGTLQLIERYLKNQDEKKLSDMAGRALNSIQRITRLLDDMVEPVIYGNKTIILNKTRFDMSALASEVARNAEMVYPARVISMLNQDVEVPVSADRYRIMQVITNLINNAIKYSPDNTNVELSVSVMDNAVRVTVADKGIGIKPEDRLKVFGKFYRSSDTQKIDGLGIGLFICSEIILRHNGKIVIEESTGPGTIVSFTLPE